MCCMKSLFTLLLLCDVRRFLTRAACWKFGISRLTCQTFIPIAKISFDYLLSVVNDALDETIEKGKTRKELLNN